MVRAPSRLEILNAIESMLNDALNKIPVTYITNFSSIYRYIEECKKSVTDELRRLREQKERRRKERQQKIELLVEKLMSICADRSLSISVVKRELRTLLEKTIP